MKSLAPHSIRQRAATLFSAAPLSLIVIAVLGIAALVSLVLAFCIHSLPQFFSFAASFAQAGIVVSICATFAARLWSAAHKQSLQDRRRLVRIRIENRRRD